MIAIRDRQRRGWVLYPHGVANFGVLIADDAAHALADHIGGRHDPWHATRLTERFMPDHPAHSGDRPDGKEDHH